MLVIFSAATVYNKLELKASLSFFFEPHILGCIFGLFSSLGCSRSWTSSDE